MARYSLYVMKVPLNLTNQPTLQRATALPNKQYSGYYKEREEEGDQRTFEEYTWNHKSGQ